ncbi:MAG TPA: hypothetical protein VIY73_23210 [Polyangiaceae bacterium]
MESTNGTTQPQANDTTAAPPPEHEGERPYDLDALAENVRGMLDNAAHDVGVILADEHDQCDGCDVDTAARAASANNAIHCAVKELATMTFHVRHGHVRDAAAKTEPAPTRPAGLATVIDELSDLDEDLDVIESAARDEDGAGVLPGTVLRLRRRLKGTIEQCKAMNGGGDAAAPVDGPPHLVQHAELVDASLATLHAAVLEIEGELHMPDRKQCEPFFEIIRREVASLHETAAHMRRASMRRDGGAS